MSSFILFIAFIVIIYIFFKSKLAFRKKLRKIIRKHPNTIRYLKNGTFNKHELFKSLRDKIYAELSGEKIPVNRRNLDKIIDQEIIKVLKGWKRRLSVYLGALASIFCLLFIAALVLPETPSKSTSAAQEGVNNKSQEDLSKVNALIASAEAHIGKSEFTLAKQDLDNVLKIDGSSQDAIKLHAQVLEKINEENKRKIEEEKKLKNEEYFNTGISYMNNGQVQKAINQLEKVSKDSERYNEAQDQINTIKRNLYLEDSKDINYKELQKNPERFKGKTIHFYGKIYNIQEVNGKTILSLSTTYDNIEFNIGAEALILFPKTTPLKEGDIIHIYGEMLGNYSKNHDRISEYLKADQYTIYFDQRTFIEQVPVIKTKIIVDIKGNMYEE